MANQRMFLRCRSCGEAIMLGKRMASGYYAAPEPEALQAFYAAHEYCDVAPVHPDRLHIGRYDPENLPQIRLDLFDIVYEGPPE